MSRSESGCSRKTPRDTTGSIHALISARGQVKSITIPDCTSYGDRDKIGIMNTNEKYIERASLDLINAVKSGGDITGLANKLDKIIKGDVPLDMLIRALDDPNADAVADKVVEKLEELSVNKTRHARVINLLHKQIDNIEKETTKKYERKIEILNNAKNDAFARLEKALAEPKENTSVAINDRLPVTKHALVGVAYLGTGFNTTKGVEPKGVVIKNALGEWSIFTEDETVTGLTDDDVKITGYLVRNPGKEK